MYSDGFFRNNRRSYLKQAYVCVHVYEKDEKKLLNYRKKGRNMRTHNFMLECVLIALYAIERKW